MLCHGLKKNPTDPHRHTSTRVFMRSQNICARVTEEMGGTACTAEDTEKGAHERRARHAARTDSSTTPAPLQTTQGRQERWVERRGWRGGTHAPIRLQEIPALKIKKTQPNNQKRIIPTHTHTQKKHPHRRLACGVRGGGMWGGGPAPEMMRSEAALGRPAPPSEQPAADRHRVPWPWKPVPSSGHPPGLRPKLLPCASPRGWTWGGVTATVQ